MKSLIQTFLAGVVGALTVSVLLGAAGALELTDAGIRFPDGTVQTTAAVSDSRRAFYLTPSTFRGYPYDTPGPRDACTQGFHMASLWEIQDVSTLRYATDSEGGFDVLRKGDSGQGPPSDAYGWIRTGYASDRLTAVEGKPNCEAWMMSHGEPGFGTTAALQARWDAATGTGDPAAMIAPWDSAPGFCVGLTHVWCVED